MNIYLVDFENVNSQGLNGINRLDGGDRIIIFYSENADSMTFDLHEQINQSRAEIHFQKVDVGTKNALDFQLATYLGYLVCENEKEGISADYYVVTKDRGYSSLVTYWTKRSVDITLVGSLIQSMRIQKERNDEKRRAQERAEEQAKSAASAVEPLAVGETAQTGEQEAIAQEPAWTWPAEESALVGEPESGSEFERESWSDAPEELVEETTREEAPGETAPEESAAEEAQEPAEGDFAPAAEEEPAEAALDLSPEEEKPKRTRSRRRTRTTAEQTADRELRIRVEQAVPDKDVVDLVVSYIKKYKTKLGINNALAKEFKDSKKASEIYKSIKPLIADKKGQ